MSIDHVTLPAAAREPRAAAKSRHAAVALALIAIGLGVVALRDASVTLGYAAGAPWIHRAIAAVNGLQPHWWMIPAGGVAVTVGAWLMLWSVWPRRKTAIAVTAPVGVWIQPDDAARLATDAAASIPGVEILRAQATRRTLKLYIVLAGDAPDSDQKATVLAEVNRAIQILSPPPKVKIRVCTRSST